MANKAPVNNRPKKGDRIKVGPIRKQSDVRRIKALLEYDYRDLALFTLGINTGYRANELLSLKVGDVRWIEAGEPLEIYQSKTGKYRRVILNSQVVKALQYWIVHARLVDDDYLFRSRYGGPISVSYLNTLVKKWCKTIRLQGNYGSHTLRKTWGYHQRKYNNQQLPVLMEAFGHTTQRQTLEYLCICSDEVEAMFSYEI